MPKTTPEEITLKKEYIRFLNNQIYKLNRQQKYLTKQLARIQAQIRDYEKEKKKVEKRSKPQDQQTNSQMAYLQNLSQQASPPAKAEVRETVRNRNNSKSPNLNTLYLIGGLVLFGIAVLVIGY
ncbi:9089_t:CDS:2 [Entrophospora sp. SA101]|nr:9089_t:CDS:2 [Entrophospora sp. SA101]